MIGDGLVFTIIISWCYVRYHTGVITVKTRKFSGHAKFLINREGLAIFIY